MLCLGLWYIGVRVILDAVLDAVHWFDCKDSALPRPRSRPPHFRDVLFGSLLYYRVRGLSKLSAVKFCTYLVGAEVLV